MYPIINQKGFYFSRASDNTHYRMPYLGALLGAVIDNYLEIRN